MKLLKWHLMQPRFCNKQALTSVDESSKVWRNLASCCDFGHSSHSSFPLRRVKTKLNFKAEKLNTYRFCDNVWTFMLNDVDFKELSEFGTVDRVKIVACDAKAAALPSNRYDD